MNELKLNPGERSILATFRHGNHAQAAIEELKQAGYEEVQMDRLTGLAGTTDYNDNVRPGIGEYSQTSAVLTEIGRAQGNDVRVLLAATPEVSGMSGEPVNVLPPFLVAVVTSDGKADRAVEIIQKHGGRV